VESAICLFCHAHGKEELDVGDVCLRKRSKNFQTYTASWRIDKMKNHNIPSTQQSWQNIKSVNQQIRRHISIQHWL
jgi:hypothetical protein